VSFKSELRASLREQGSSPCSTGCDVYRYQMTGLRHWERWPFTCAAFSDTGELIEGSERSSWYNLAAQTSCDGIEPGPCTAQEIATVQNVCASGLEVASCQRECATQEVSCRVDLPAPVDACTQPFEYGGQTWPNLGAFCAAQGSGWQDCRGGGLDIQYETSLSGTYSQKTLMEGNDTAAVGSYFRAKAESVFGPGKYLVQGILFDPQFSCPLGSGQSHAANLARTIGDPRHVFPLCESYAPALAGVLDFAQALIQTEFTLSLKDDEHVTNVVVLAADGSERTLAEGDYDFDEVTGRLTIAPTAITSTDSNLRIEVTSDCRPIVK
jgi:hypothetical protein